VYKTGKLICSACHEDRHGGQFAAAPLENRCDQCHTAEGFPATTFTAARHAASRFPLIGGHAKVECAACHKPLDAASPQPRRYRFAALTCDSCHADPHRTKAACETCHTPEGWKAVRPFDHSATRFRLENAHANAKCSQCHTPQPGTAKPAPDFAGASTACYSCHEAKDVHAGQFRAAGREEDCATCHVPARWDQPIFSHNQTRYPLDVAHRNVACAKCHKEQVGAAARPVRIYRGTPLECVKCH
jgi:hypothetical protein